MLRLDGSKSEQVSGRGHRVTAETITEHGCSQIEMANFLGLHYSTISRIVAADKEANVKT
jgi:plasmid maintenance system antidote protein VapI